MIDVLIQSALRGVKGAPQVSPEFWITNISLQTFSDQANVHSDCIPINDLQEIAKPHSLLDLLQSFYIITFIKFYFHIFIYSHFYSIF